MAHCKTNHQTYRKTGTEWEILGDLAARLHHKVIEMMMIYLINKINRIIS